MYVHMHVRTYTVETQIIIYIIMYVRTRMYIIYNINYYLSTMYVRTYMYIGPINNSLPCTYVHAYV